MPGRYRDPASFCLSELCLVPNRTVGCFEIPASCLRCCGTAQIRAGWLGYQDTLLTSPLPEGVPCTQDLERGGMESQLQC